jgi:hypothetical protein
MAIALFRAMQEGARALVSAAGQHGVCVSAQLVPSGAAWSSEPLQALGGMQCLRAVLRYVGVKGGRRLD